MIEPELHHFSADGGFPNSHLPLLVYRSAVLPDPAAMESTFAANGWSNSWRNGIFAITISIASPTRFSALRLARSPWRLAARAASRSWCGLATWW